nr:hypothetical protein [Sphingomonas sp. Y57]
MTAYRPSVRHGLALAALLLAGSIAHAEERVIALSPAEKEKLLDAAAQRLLPIDDALPVNGLGRQVHGQVGMFVGTGGSRGVFGSAIAPLGEKGQIAVAFENSRFGR